MTTSPFVVGLIVGSVSQPSINRRLGDALTVLAPRAGLELRDIPIGELPFYGTQYDQGYPPVGAAYKQAVEAVDGLAIVTPEYNRSIPAVLKNAIDWTTRPPGQSSLEGKPVGIIGTSRNAVSTAVAQAHLRSVLTSRGAALLARPEAHVRYTVDLFDDDGAVTDPKVEKLLLSWLEELRRLIERYR